MKSYKNIFHLHRIFVIIFSLMGIQFLYSQSMSGNYTIGGSSPDFATLQNAADALIANGVSGPVIFLIRPGSYMNQGGLQPVMLLEQNVNKSKNIIIKEIKKMPLAA